MDRSNRSFSHEDMLMTLDQLDQTLEVMGQVVDRLRFELKQNQNSTEEVHQQLGELMTDIAVH